MDPIETFAGVLVAEEPRPELAEHLAVFAPLIGSWDLRVFEYGADGSLVEETAAEWHFSWVLDGRAVADVWINPRRVDRGPGADGEWGLSVRFYDAAIGAFRSTWLGPKRGLVMPFLARPTEDGIELAADRDGVAHRWVFSELTAGSFRWRREEDGAVRQRSEATRAA
jgi:hypothetical protein